MSKYTYRQTASDYNLWLEYVSPLTDFTREEFDQLTVEVKMQMITNMFGEEDAPEVFHGAELELEED